MNNKVTRQVLGKVAMTSRGEYDTSKSYEILDIVTYQGSSYISKKYNNDSLPTNADDWQLLAQKGDTYELSEEDLQRIAEQITSNANSAFNQNVKEKTDSFNSNANSKTEAYNTNATEKLGAYNSNHTAKLKEYNDNATSKLSAYNTNTVAKTTEYNSNHTSKLNAYDTNASSKIDEYNTNADTRLEEYNTNADNKIAEYDEHSKELNNKIVSTRNELERLKSNVLNTGEDTDTFIHLEDSAMAELQELSVDGVCKQTTTTGKNQANTKITKWNYLGVTVDYEEETQILTINGTATGDGALNFKNYNFSIISLASGERLNLVEKYISGNCISNNNSRISFTDENYVLSMIIPLNKINSDIVVYKTTSIDLTYNNLQLVYKTGDVFNNLKIKLMVSKGDDTSYEPYTGGQPSPSPDYPQEIKTIENSLKITSCNKNLVYSWYSPKDKKQYIRNLYAKFPIKPNTQYTISLKDNNFGSNSFYTNESLFTSKFLGPNNGRIYAIVNSLDEKKLNSAKTNSYDYTENGWAILKNNKEFTNEPIFEDVQIVEGNTIDFEGELHSQIEANLPEGEFIGKLNDTYKDTLRTEYFPEEGQYHLMLYKNIGKVVLDSSYYVNYKTPNNNIQVVFKSQNDYGVRGQGLCDFYQYGDSRYVDKFDISMGEGSSIYFHTPNESINTNELFKEWLDKNKPTVYYKLAKPYTLDLGVVDMPLSYNEVTNIFTDSDLLPTINAKYYRVFDKTIQNAQINEKTLKQEITDLNATVSALDTRLKVLENKTVEEPTESEGTV